MENIIANSHELKGKQQENVERFAEQGLMSKKLATINLNVPVELDEAGLEMCAPSKDLLEPLFAELEFRTLGRRVFGDDFSITETNAVSIQTDLFGEPGSQGRTTMTVDVQDIDEPELKPSRKNINNVPHEYHLADTTKNAQN